MTGIRLGVGGVVHGIAPLSDDNAGTTLSHRQRQTLHDISSR